MSRSTAPLTRGQNRACLQRRRIKNAPFPVARKATPLPWWKLRVEVWSVKTPVRAGRSGMGECSVGCPAADSSARKLAAALWHSVEVADVGGDGWQSSIVGGRAGLEHNARHRHLPNVRDHSAIVNDPASPTSPSNSETTRQIKLEASSMLPYFAMERATKWDYAIYCNHGDDKKLHEDQSPYVISPANIALLREELRRARSRIDELESERHLAKQKLDRLLGKVAEEMASRQTRDQNEKLRNVLKAIKDDLGRERRNRKKMEVLNSQLVNELAGAKLLAKQYLQEYEKERKAREMVEDACDELAKGIGDDKAKVESLKRESMKIQEELEGERGMLQMAEVWREERVQMKLADAKLVLEEKYAELMKLRAHLDSFLMAHADHGTNANDDLVLKEAAMLREAADSIKLHEIELHYRSPVSGDDNNFSLFEELKPRIKEANEQRDTESPETDIFLGNNEIVNRDHEDAQDGDDLSCLENSLLIEGHDSCTCPDQVGNCPSVDGTSAKRDDCNMDTETSEICSATSRQKSRKKASSSIGRFWRFASKKHPVELSNGRRLSGTDSSSPASVTAGNKRGTKGCVEWQITGRTDDHHKVQLRQVLENKS